MKTTRAARSGNTAADMKATIKTTTSNNNSTPNSSAVKVVNKKSLRASQSGSVFENNAPKNQMRNNSKDIGLPLATDPRLEGTGLPRKDPRPPLEDYHVYPSEPLGVATGYNLASSSSSPELLSFTERTQAKGAVTSGPDAAVATLGKSAFEHKPNTIAKKVAVSRAPSPGLNGARVSRTSPTTAVTATKPPAATTGINMVKNRPAGAKRMVGPRIASVGKSNSIDKSDPTGSVGKLRSVDPRSLKDLRLAGQKHRTRSGPVLVAAPGSDPRPVSPMNASTSQQNYDETRFAKVRPPVSSGIQASRKPLSQRAISVGKGKEVVRLKKNGMAPGRAGASAKAASTSSLLGPGGGTSSPRQLSHDQAMAIKSRGPADVQNGRSKSPTTAAAGVVVGMGHSSLRSQRSLTFDSNGSYPADLGGSAPGGLMASGKDWARDNSSQTHRAGAVAVSPSFNPSERPSANISRQGNYFHAMAAKGHSSHNRNDKEHENETPAKKAASRDFDEADTDEAPQPTLSVKRQVATVFPGAVAVAPSSNFAETLEVPAASPDLGDTARRDAKVDDDYDEPVLSAHLVVEDNDQDEEEASPRTSDGGAMNRREAQVAGFDETALSAHLVVEDQQEKSPRSNNGDSGIKRVGSRRAEERSNSPLTATSVDTEGQEAPMAERSEDRQRTRLILYCALALLIVAVAGVIGVLAVARGLYRVSGTQPAIISTSTPSISPTLPALSNPPGNHAPSNSPRNHPADTTIAPLAPSEDAFPCVRGGYYYSYHDDRLRRIGFLDVVSTNNTVNQYLSTPDCHLRDIVIDRAGVAYGRCHYSSFLTLVTVDLSSGNTTAIATFPSMDYSGLAYNPVDDHLYTSLSDRTSSLVKIEKDGTFTNIGFGLESELHGFAIDSNGNAFGTDRGGRLFSINLADGTSVWIISLPFESQNIAFRGPTLYGIGMFDSAPLFVVDVTGDPAATTVGFTNAEVTIGGGFCPLG